MPLLAGALATAAALGVTHAAEPDHLAGIAATAGPTASPRRAALVGGCFGAGHAVLVFVWLAVGAYAVAITASMAALGAGVGSLSARLDGRGAAGARVLAGVAVVGLAVAVGLGFA